MLGARDPVTWSPQRVLVAGVSGVGKSTLAQRIGARLAIPYTEIDGLYHGPNWTPRASFAADVDAYTGEPAWVTEWQYRAVRPLLAARADTLVWLDLPAIVAYSRVIRRTSRRARSREELWNGNREPGLWHAITSRDGVIRWAFSTRGKYRRTVPAVEHEHPHVHVVRLRSQREADDWVARL